MDTRIQRLRVMFECDTMSTANRVVFSLCTRVPLDGADRGLYDVLMGGVHSLGRFVFVPIEASPTDGVMRAYNFARSQLHSVALIGVTGSNVSWDQYNLRLLQSDDDPNTQLRIKAEQYLLGEYARLVDTTSISDSDLLNCIAQCRLHEDSEDGDLLVLHAARRWETYDVVESKISHCVLDSELYAARLGIKGCDAEGTKLIWRVMVYLLLRQQLLS